MRLRRAVGRLFGGVFVALLLLAGCSGGPSPASPTAGILPTPAPSTAPSEAPIFASPQPAGAGTSASVGAEAVEAVVAYYRAINARDYAAAYALWRDDGRASGQSPEAFAQGFAETRRVELLIGQPRPAGEAPTEVTVPVTVIAATDSTVQGFAGTYTLAPAGGDAAGWVIVNAAVTPTTAPPVSSPEDILVSYYQAINQGNFPAAYSLWGDVGASSQQAYQAFAQGFAMTQHVTLTVGPSASSGAAGSVYSDVPVTLVATERDGRQIRFCGVYTLRKLNAVGGGGMPWRIDHAAISEGSAGCPEG